jgi:opacity protein-like surface antigen
VAFFTEQTLHGFDVAATRYLSRGFGLTGNFSAHYHGEHFSRDSFSSKQRLRIYNVLGGVQYKFRRDRRVRPFARALAGLTRTSHTLEINFSTPGSTSKDTPASTDFALATGGGLDVRVNDHLELRTFQFDYNPVYVSRDNQFGFGKARANHIRFSFGVVFR